MAYECGAAGAKPFKDQPPKVGEPNRDVNFAAVGEKTLQPQSGKDTYQGIPGDGVVPG